MAASAIEETPPPMDDPHLRSAMEVCGYQVHATDADVGRIDDLIFDDANWSIGYLTASTGSWLGCQRLMLSTRWSNSISWSHRQVRLVHVIAEM